MAYEGNNKNEHARSCDKLDSPKEVSGAVPTINFEEYRELLEDADLSEAQKCELIQALYSIMLEFTALAWGLNPTQLSGKKCGKLSQGTPKLAMTVPDEVSSDIQSLVRNFVEAEKSSESSPKGVDS